MSETFTLEHRLRFAVPDTPPELVSSNTSSSSSTSSPPPPRQRDIRVGATSFSMPSYDKASVTNMSPTDKPAEIGQPRIEPPSHLGSRQQLPSLSSLFGPPSTVRPLHSPHSDRPGSYPLTSPLDRPRLASGGASTSYFPQTTSPSFSQPRTYDAKPEHDRHSLQQLAPPFSGASSPRFPADASLNRSGSRPDADLNSKWSMQHDSAYSLGSRDSAYRSPPDHLRLQFPGPRDPAHGYQEHRPTQGGPNPPPTPASTVASDGIPSKDGLGPKIWTGTHFLPRFVRAADVPGEGLCYFYDDGSHCKTVIDGEAVNAHWGVTKAGKPRKRLAIACITCREKKIKCDPDYPRCVQCEKFGRICKFKNAPRGGHNLSPSTPPAELDDLRKLGDTPRSGEARLSKSDGGSPISPRVALRHPSPEAGPNKRQRLENGVYNPNGDHLAAVPRSPEQCKSQIVMQRPAPDLPRLPDEVLSRAWRTDPYVSDPQSISAVISQFFDLVDNTIIMRFVPEDAFKTWLANTAHKKSAEELMLVYSMLAVGVLLSGGPKHIASEYAQVANYAQKTSEANNLHLAQSRILLALYYVSAAQRCEANELMSAAAGTAACLQLNMELEASREANIPAYAFGLNKAGYSESRRRTFWSLFMLERLSGMFPDRLIMLHSEDTYLRLPADSHTFERQLESYMPFFDAYHSPIPAMPEKPSDASAYLIEVVSIWSRCEHVIYRMSRRPRSSNAGMPSMHDLQESLERWHRALPPKLTLSTHNVEQADKGGYIGSFFTMHLLFNHAMAKTYRHQHPNRHVTDDVRTDLLHQCRAHAKKLLDIGAYVEHVLRARPNALNTPPPVSGLVLTEAIDILSASGLVEHVGELLRDTQMVQGLIERTAAVWEECRVAERAIAGRLGKLSQIRDQTTLTGTTNLGFRLIEERNEAKGLRWAFEESMDRACPKNTDVVYMLHD